MEPGARKRAAWAVSALPRTRVVLVEASKRSASRFGEAGRSLHRPGPLRGAKPPCRLVARGAAVCTMAWTPADAPPVELGGVARRTACVFFVGCRLARGRSVPRGSSARYGSPSFARRGSVLPTLERGPPAEEGVSIFKLWSSEPLVKISHSCQCQQNRAVLQHARLVQPVT